MFDSQGGGGLDRVVAAFADLTGCDRTALAALVDHRSTLDAGTTSTFDAAAVLDRIGASERLAQAAQAVQVEELAVFNAGYLADADEGVAERDHQLPWTSRLAGIEVAEQLRVAPITASLKIANAIRAVESHRPVLDLVGTGAVSMAGLGRVLDATDVLTPALQQQVAAAVASEAVRRELTPGQLGKAADRRVLAADPDAAAKRVAAARRDRSVRLGDPIDGVAGVYATVRAEEAAAIWSLLDSTARHLRGHGDPRSLNTLRADLFVAYLTGRPLTRIPDAEPGSSSEQAAPSAQTPGAAAEAGSPVVWRRTRGVEPAFGEIPPPLLPDPDPDPDDPVWDTYLGPHPDEDARSVPDVMDPGGADPVAQWRAGVDVEVQVVVSLATVLGLDRDPGLLRGYGAIPADTIGEIIEVAQATQATTWLRTLFCDPVDGRLVGMTSRSQRFTDELRRFGLFRDQTDRLTGGPISDLDHIHPKAEGGQTTAANEQGLGPFTNRVAKEHPQVHVRALPVDERGDGLDGYRRHAPDIEWMLPSGQRHVSRPPPVLGAGSDPQDTAHDTAAAAGPDHGADMDREPDDFPDPAVYPGAYIDPASTSALDNELFALLEAATA